MTPNPESALNEIAGKLLLEDYDAFWQRAQLMTRVHASRPKSSAQESLTEDPEATTTAKKRITTDEGDAESVITTNSSSNALNQMRKKLRRL